VKIIKTLKETAVEVKPAKAKSSSVAGKTQPANVNELESSLMKAIDSQLESSNGTFWKQSGGFAPSSTNQCARYMVYRFRGYEQVVDFSGRTRRIFDLGNRAEEFLRDMFENLGILLDEQIAVEIESPPVRGFADFLIDWDGPKPVECKSINEAGFVWRKNYRKPKDEHYRQLQFYLEAMDMDEGFVVYICKNDSAMLPLLIKRDKEFMDKILKKYAKIYKVYQDGNLPVRPYKQTSEKCQRCDARDYCWADTEEGIKV
jgi:CRISPR/Cas system-associated exonuclease Cas4 (RecB family)